jgi:hypothetical protein
MKQEKQLSSQEALPVMEEEDLQKVTGGVGLHTPLLGGQPHRSDMAHPKSLEHGNYLPPDQYMVKVNDLLEANNYPKGTDITLGQQDKTAKVTMYNDKGESTSIWLNTGL